MFGFLPERAVAPGGLGVRVMREAVEEINGRCLFNQEPFTGWVFGGPPGEPLTIDRYEDGVHLGEWTDPEDPVPWYRDDDLDEIEEDYKTELIDQINGQPVTGWVVEAPDGVVAELYRVESGVAYTEMGIQADGRATSQLRGVPRTTSEIWGDSQFWYSSGEIKSVSSSPNRRGAGPSGPVSLSLEFDKETRLTGLTGLGAYFDVANRTDRSGDAWVLTTPEPFRSMSAGTTLRLYSDGDPWWSYVLQLLAENNGLDHVEQLITLATSFDYKQLRWLTSQPLPALKCFTIDASAFVDRSLLAYGDLVRVMLDFKRERPSVEIRVGPMWLAQNQHTPDGIVLRNAVGYFDSDYRHIVKILDPEMMISRSLNDRESDFMFEWLVAQPTLKQVDITEPVSNGPPNTRDRLLIELRERRPDINISFVDPLDLDTGSDKRRPAKRTDARIDGKM